MKRAVAWIRRHGPAYGIDPAFLVVTGGSAGGHLAAILALTANESEYQPGFEPVDTSVAACVGFYAAYDVIDRHQVWRHDGLLRLRFLAWVDSRSVRARRVLAAEGAALPAASARR